MFDFLKPVDPKETGDFVVRCSCGRAMWLKAPDKVRRHHLGHKMTPLEHGTMFEFIKMKTGLLNRRTFSEWYKDLIMGAGK